MFRQVSSAVNFLKPCNTKRQKPLHCTAAGRWSRWFFFADAPSVLLETNCQNRVFQDREVYCFLEDYKPLNRKPTASTEIFNLQRETRCRATSRLGSFKVTLTISTFV